MLNPIKNSIASKDGIVQVLLFQLEKEKEASLFSESFCEGDNCIYINLTCRETDFDKKETYSKANLSIDCVNLSFIIRFWHK